MANTWNGNYVPTEGDFWKLVDDLRKHANQNNRIIPVNSLEERTALAAAAPGGVIPPGTVVIRLDLGGVLDRFVDGKWIDGRPVFRSLTISGELSLPQSDWLTIWNMEFGSGDDPHGIAFQGGVGTIQRDGRYEAKGQISFPAAVGGTRGVNFLINGTKLNRTLYPGLSGGTYQTLLATWEGRLKAGDTIELQGFQNLNPWMTLNPDPDLTRWTITKTGD